MRRAEKYDRAPGPHEQVVKRLLGAIDLLYEIGARNFLLIDVPPIDKSPARKLSTVMIFPRAHISYYLSESGIPSFMNKPKPFTRIPSTPTARS